MHVTIRLEPSGQKPGPEVTFSVLGNWLVASSEKNVEEVIDKNGSQKEKFSYKVRRLAENTNCTYQLDLNSELYYFVLYLV